MEFEMLKKIIAEVSGVYEGELTLETTFIEDLGVDSLDVYQIVSGIEQTFDIEIPEDQIEAVVTIGDAVNLIRNAS